MLKRNFVFLQGMPCRFFSKLAEELLARGHSAARIFLCFGDKFFWNKLPGESYRGRLADWPAYFRRYVQQNGITDLVLLGEQRKYHREAVAVAHKLGIRVTATDYGYLRPDWITLERDGMGGNSRFPKQPAAIRQLATNLTTPDFVRRYHDSDLHMAIGDLIYSFGNLLLSPLYPRYKRSDERPHPIIYFPAEGIRLLTQSRRNEKAMRCFKQLDGARTPYFVFPMQLEHDFQIVAYSQFNRLDDVLDDVIGSFARNTDDAVLIIKSHPWDTGLKNWRKRIEHIATRHSASSRVVFLDGGNLDQMMEDSQGVVTVNSTSGIKALQQGRPVKTLGQAIYDIEGLTCQQPLDEFWKAPPRPDPDLTNSFVTLVAATIQIRGTHFTQEGMKAAARNAADQLCRDEETLAPWLRTQQSVFETAEHPA